MAGKIRDGHHVLIAGLPDIGSERIAHLHRMKGMVCFCRTGIQSVVAYRVVHSIRKVSGHLIDCRHLLKERTLLRCDFLMQFLYLRSCP